MYAFMLFLSYGQLQVFGSKVGW